MLPYTYPYNIYVCVLVNCILEIVLCACYHIPAYIIFMYVFGFGQPYLLPSAFQKSPFYEQWFKTAISRKQFKQSKEKLCELYPQRPFIQA